MSFSFFMSFLGLATHKLAAIRGLLAISVFVTTLLLFYFPSSFEKFDALISDSLSRLQISDDTPDLITIIDIDDTSLQTIHSWPWPRSLLADLLISLQSEHSPRVILLDVLLPEAKGGDEDRYLESVIGQSPVCLSQAFDLVEQPNVRELGQLSLGRADLESAWPAFGFVANYPSLANQARCVGHITPLVDGDGIIRHIPFSIGFDQQAWLSLADSALVFSGLLDRSFRDDAKLPIAYRTAPEAWRVIPAHAVLFETLTPGMLDGHFVLIGSSALGLSDRVSTPIHPWLPGYVVHAEQLAYRLYPPSDFLVFKPSAWLFAILTIALVFGLVMRFNVLFAMVVSILFLAVWFGLVGRVWYQFSDIYPSLPLIATGLSFMLLLPFEWLVASRQAKKVTAVFKDYVTPEVVDQLVKNSSDYVTPKARIVTVLFADIEGFTQLAKHCSTSELANLTQSVLSIMSEAVYANRGTLDKYLGDAVMAFWNAPLESPNHAQLAFDAAVLIQQKMAEFNANRSGKPIGVRIGIHTGEAMVGDLGTRYRHAYTAIGDSVNIAHRLQTHARSFNTSILLSEQTFRLLAKPSGWPFEKVDTESVRF